MKKLARIPLLAALALALTACAGSTGFRGNLNDSVSVQARQSVETSCDGIPRPWPAPADGKDYTAEETERHARRDRRDSLRCAGAGLTYADHIRRRDTKLSGKR